MEDVSDILSAESVELKVEPSSDMTQPQINDLGQLVPVTVEPYAVHEPLIPAGLNTSQQALLTAAGGGSVAVYQAYWYSQHNGVPDGSHVSKVSQPDVRYKTTSLTDYSDFAGFTVYGLEAVKRERNL